MGETTEAEREFPHQPVSASANHLLRSLRRGARERQVSERACAGSARG